MEGRVVVTALPMERFDLEAKYMGSRLAGRKDLTCCMTSRLKPFIIRGVRATGW